MLGTGGGWLVGAFCGVLFGVFFAASDSATNSSFGDRYTAAIIRAGQFGAIIGGVAGAVGGYRFVHEPEYTTEATGFYAENGTKPPAQTLGARLRLFSLEGTGEYSISSSRPRGHLGLASEFGWKFLHYYGYVGGGLVDGRFALVPGLGLHIHVGPVGLRLDFHPILQSREGSSNDFQFKEANFSLGASWSI